MRGFDTQYTIGSTTKACHPHLCQPEDLREVISVTTVSATIKKPHLWRPQKPLLARDVALGIKSSHLWTRIATHHQTFSPSSEKSWPKVSIPLTFVLLTRHNYQKLSPSFEAKPSTGAALAPTITKAHHRFDGNYQFFSPLLLNVLTCFVASRCFVERILATINSSHPSTINSPHLQPSKKLTEWPLGLSESLTKTIKMSHLKRRNLLNLQRKRAL